MSEPTVSRKTLRQAIGRAAGMTFFKRYATGSVMLSTGPTVSSLPCTDLTQEDHFWQNGYVYISNLDVERRIADFTAQNDVIIPEYPLAVAPTSTDDMEIYEVWPPTTIHEAINRAIREGGQYYPDVVTDETLIVQEHKMSYALTGLTQVPNSLLQVWIQRSSESIMGTAAGGDSNTILIDTMVDLSDLDTDWDVSIYHGKGSGQVQEVSSVVAATGTINIGDTWVTSPDTTSEFRLWNGAKEETDWYKIADVRPDAPDYPSTLYFNQLYTSANGFRIRLIYTADPPDLTAEAGTTVVPREFITNKALSILHDEMTGQNRSDRQMHANLAEYYDQLARDFARRVRRPLPGRTIGTEGPSGVHPSIYNEDGNPLGW